MHLQVGYNYYLCMTCLSSAPADSAKDRLYEEEAANAI